MTGRCAYEHDVSGDRFDDVSGDRWSCPHPAEGDRCVFHGEADDAARRDRLLAAVAADPSTNRFIGAAFGDLDLDYREIDGRTGHPIDCRDATFGSLSWRFGRSDHPVDLRGATVEGRFDVADTTFRRRVDLDDARFEGPVSVRLATFESWVGARRAVFAAPVDARDARFGAGLYAPDVEFATVADFTDARFDDELVCTGAGFAAGACFADVTVVDTARFDDATFEAPVACLRSSSGRERDDAPDFGDTATVDAAATFAGARFDKHLSFEGATFDGDLRLRDLRLARDLHCGDVRVETDAATVDLTETETVTGTVSAADDRLTYELTDATVGDLDLVDASSFDAVHFRDTQFEGFDFGGYKDLLGAVEYRLHDPGDTPDVRENTYLRAKNGAKRAGANRAIAEFFLREMRARRASHARNVRDSAGIERLRHAGRYLGNLGLSVTCGYGERPSRTVVISLAVVFGFALLYAALDVSLTIGESALGYLTFSVQSFVALLLGGPAADSVLISFLGAVEGFVGGFMIALFVFALTRSVSR